jgi:predicted DNA-binding transcriptional regulator YafY
MEPPLAAHTSHPGPKDTIDMARVRTCIRTQGKIEIVYRDEKAQDSKRIVWPIAVSYWDAVRLIVAWCELRKAFRLFRADRVIDACFLEDRYATPRSRLRAQWRKEMRDDWERRKARVDATAQINAARME